MSDAARLYDRHGLSLYRYALMLLADPDAAEDAVQQVFVSLLKEGRLASIDNQEHYLRRAVRNECYSMLRRPRRMPMAEPTPRLIEPVQDAGASMEERLALDHALRALPMEQREVVHLHVFQGMTFNEIASISGDSINTIASRYRYALDKIREFLRD